MFKKLFNLKSFIYNIFQFIIEKIALKSEISAEKLF